MVLRRLQKKNIYIHKQKIKESITFLGKQSSFFVMRANFALAVMLAFQCNSIMQLASKPPSSNILYLNVRC